MSEPVCKLYAAAACDPNLWARLSPAARVVARYTIEVMARPEQLFPAGDWRSLGYVCGRGFGKTTGIAANMNLLVERGVVRAPALAGPTDDRVDEVQIQNLIDCAPPWFKPERWNKTIRWPNGVVAEVHSAESPMRPRSSNLDLTWMCELVAWNATTRWDFYANITTATRVGIARFVWDTTSKGRNELILDLEAKHARNPSEHRIIRGTTFHNPMLSAKYLRDECAKYEGQTLDEELGGRVFDGASGALWSTTTLGLYRRAARPPGAPLTLIGVDPALTTTVKSDETGIVFAERGRDGHVYVFDDQSGKHGIDAWATIVVDGCEAGAAGVVIERNRGGDQTSYPILSIARTREIEVVFLKKDESFPPWRRGVIYIREVWSDADKGQRATGPAAEYRAGRCHLVGDALKKLEFQLTTFVPGLRGQKSPNSYDAHNMVVTELAGLEHDQPGVRQQQDARQAEDAQAELMKRLAGAGKRSVGL